MDFMSVLTTISENAILLNNDFENSPFHYHVKGKNGKYITCNKRVLADAGFTKEQDLIGLTDLDLKFLPEQQALAFRKHDLHVQQTGRSKLFIEALTLPHSEKLTDKFVAMSYKYPLISKLKKIIGTQSVSFIIDVKNIDFSAFINSLSNPYLINTTNLTVRQTDCLFYLVKGMTIKQIAFRLNLSPKTVEHYIDTIKIKLNCYSRSELIDKALQIKSIREKL